MFRFFLCFVLLFIFGIFCSKPKNQPIGSDYDVRFKLPFTANNSQYVLYSKNKGQTCKNSEDQSVFYSNCCIAQIIRDNVPYKEFNNTENICFLNTHLLAVSWIDKDHLEIDDYMGGAADPGESRSSYNIDNGKIENLLSYYSKTSADDDSIHYISISIYKEKIQILSECKSNSSSKVYKLELGKINEQGSPIIKEYSDKCPVSVELQNGKISFIFPDKTKDLLPLTYY